MQECNFYCPNLPEVNRCFLHPPHPPCIVNYAVSGAPCAGITSPVGVGSTKPDLLPQLLVAVRQMLDFPF